MSTGAGRLARNAASVFASDAVNRAATFALYALVGRRMGPDAFGQLSLALTFFYLVQVIAGIKTLVTRDVAKDLSQTSGYLVNGAVVAIGFAAASLVALTLVVTVLAYPPGTSSLILLVCVGLLPYSVAAVFEGIFRAHERMGAIALCTIPTSVLRVVAAVAVVAGDGGLHAIALVILLSHTATALLQGWWLRRTIGARFVAPDRRAIRAISTAAMPFLGIELLVAITMSTNVLLLSKLATSRDVGLYSAASQLNGPLWLLMNSVVLATFPLLCRRHDVGPAALAQATNRLAGALVALALPAAVVGAFVADDVLRLVYGTTEFADAAVVLAFALAQLVVAGLTVLFGQVLFAGFRERLALRIVAIDAAATLVLGIVLIQLLGIVGAALAAFAVAVLELVQHYLPVARQLPDLSLRRALAPPFAAGAGATVVLLLFAGRGLVVPLLATVGTYGVLLVGLVARRVGGLRRLRAAERVGWLE